MDIEFSSYFDDLVSGWEQANKTHASNLVKRCLIKNIIKKEAFGPLMTEIDDWNGKTI